MNKAETEGAFSLVAAGGANVAGSFSWSGNTMTFDPASDLARGAEYTATVGTEAMDAANNNPLGIEKSWRFTTSNEEAATGNDVYRTGVLGTTGLVSYWRLGETSGTAAADDAPTDPNNGRYLNGVALGGPGALVTDSNPSAGFDGSNDYVSVADHASLDTGDRFTLEAWVKRSNTSTSTQTIFSKGSGSYRLSFVSNSLRLTRPGSGTIATANVSTTDTAGFHHVVATKSGATVKLYIDGVDRTGTVTNQTVANTSTALNIGRYTGGTQYFAGLIDEPAVYNSALSSTAITEHYQAKAP